MVNQNLKIFIVLITILLAFSLVESNRSGKEGHFLADNEKLCNKHDDEMCPNSTTSNGKKICQSKIVYLNTGLL